MEALKVASENNGAELVRRCRAGDGAAWEEIVSLYSRRIFNLAYRFTSSVEAAESDEFRHFLSGVDLIWKQLNGVLDALGVKPIPSVGEPFDPHVHEAVVTEATDEYEPDTVMQEIVAGYRLGDKLIRPALVKVATRK